MTSIEELQGERGRKLRMRVCQPRSVIVLVAGVKLYHQEVSANFTDSKKRGKIAVPPRLRPPSLLEG